MYPPMEYPIGAPTVWQLHTRCSSRRASGTPAGACVRGCARREPVTGGRVQQASSSAAQCRAGSDWIGPARLRSGPHDPMPHTHMRP